MEIRRVDDYIDKVAEKYDKIPKDVLKKTIEIIATNIKEIIIPEPIFIFPNI